MSEVALGLGLLLLLLGAVMMQPQDDDEEEVCLGVVPAFPLIWTHWSSCLDGF